MSEGVRLDASKPLAAYKLPQVSIHVVPAACTSARCMYDAVSLNRLSCSVEPQDQHNLTRDVFLYNKAHLRSSAILPPAESLPPAPPQGTGANAFCHCSQLLLFMPCCSAGFPQSQKGQGHSAHCWSESAANRLRWIPMVFSIDLSEIIWTEAHNEQFLQHEITQHSWSDSLSTFATNASPTALL